MVAAAPEQPPADRRPLRRPRTRTRYSFSISLSSPISCLATRPSCVSTSRPTESMSSRPAGTRLRRCSRRKRSAGRVVAPLVLRRDEHVGRFVAVFGLATHVADRFVAAAPSPRAPARRSRVGIDRDVLAWQHAQPSSIRHVGRRRAPSRWRSSRRLRGARRCRVRSCVWTGASLPGAWGVVAASSSRSASSARPGRLGA